MNSIYSIGAFLLICFALSADALAPLQFSVRASLLQATDWGCKNTGWSCKDCNVLQHCEGTTSEYTISCKDQNLALPYCSPKENKCVAKNDDCQKIVNDDFTCPDVGNFPNLLDCKQYNQCVKKDGKGELYTCVFNTVYDHVAQACKTGTKCYTSTAECAGKFKIIPYAVDSSLYIVCQGPDKLPILKKCADKKLYFNVNKMACDYKCTEEGNFEYPGNKKKYYFCAKNGNVWESVEKDCDSGTEYSPDYRFCLPVPK